MMEAVLSMRGNLIGARACGGGARGRGGVAARFPRALEARSAHRAPPPPGFHTYPLEEPAGWVGLNSSLAADGSGNVTWAYPTRWATTLEPDRAWGYNAINTSSLGFGASQIFEHECFGHETVSGDADLCPMPATVDASVELFNRVGLFWKATFAHAKALGVQTVLGTEMPLSMPAAPTPPPTPTTTAALQVWYASTRDDHFVTLTDCSEVRGSGDGAGVEQGWSEGCAGAERGSRGGGAGGARARGGRALPRASATSRVR